MSINLEGITMKTSFAAAALIIVSGLSATASFATDSTPLTRAQVRAEVLQARANGTMPASGDGDVVMVKLSPSTLTRAAVKADYLQAQKDGTLPNWGDATPIQAVSAPSTLTRAAVKAEYLQAKKDGTLPAMDDRG